jgi:hypothetical protein
MIAHDSGQRTSSADLFNDLGQPSAAGLRVFDTPHLLTGIDHETIRNTDPHLIFDERAVRKVLDSVIRIYLAPGGGLFGVLKLDRNDTLRSADQAIGLARDPPPGRAQDLSLEGLADQVLVKDLARRNTGFRPGAARQEEKQHTKEDGRGGEHQDNGHRDHPSQQKINKITASSTAAYAAHR